MHKALPNRGGNAPPDRTTHTAYPTPPAARMDLAGADRCVLVSQLVSCGSAKPGAVGPIASAALVWPPVVVAQPVASSASTTIKYT